MMSSRTRALLWAAAAVSAVFVVASFVLLVVSWSAPLPERLFSYRGANAMNAVALVALGMLIVTRRPANLVGWALLANGHLSAVYGLATEYAIYALGGGADPLGGMYAAWVVEWIWVPFFTVGFPIALLLFPTGRLISPAWRWVVVLALGVGAVQTSVFAFSPSPLRILSYGTPNPFALDGLGPQLAAIEAVIRPASALVFFLAFAQMIVRARRGSTVVRQQLKWLTLAGLGAGTSYTLALGFPHIEAFETLVTLSGMTAAAAITIAILRHRLLDIDRIVDRTLVYGAVTVMLVGTYATAVVLLQTPLRPFTAGSDLAVAASTLLVVALFQPLRRRVQDAVDRRFYRARYDAARTLDAFSARLRNEVEIESVRSDLLGAVDATVRPSHASVWLRGVRHL